MLVARVRGRRGGGGVGLGARRAWRAVCRVGVCVWKVDGGLGESCPLESNMNGGVICVSPCCGSTVKFSRGLALSVSFLLSFVKAAEIYFVDDSFDVNVREAAWEARWTSSSLVWCCACSCIIIFVFLLELGC